MKYKNNGEWKEITIKAKDTLPVGSIVDYDGTDIPDGWEEIKNIIVLYENSSGNNGTIQLNDSAENYEYIEIFYGKGKACSSVKLYRPNNMNDIPLNSSNSFGSGQVQTLYANININGSTITRGYMNYINFYGGSLVDSVEENWCYIYRVVGYK